MSAEQAHHFLEFARSMRRTSPLYGAIAAGCAEDPDVLDLLDHAPVAQRRNTLLFASVHYLLLSGVEHPLAQWYPSLTDQPELSDPFPAFRDFCGTFRASLEELLTTRYTQTNEVGRCAALRAAWASIDEPIALVDVGASAGLTLLLDKYGYEYEPGGCCGTGPVTIRCATREAVPPMGIPEIVERRGLDQSPVDVTDPDRRLWLQACVWADDTSRLRVLQGALAMAAADPPTVMQGDAVDDLAKAVDELPSGVTLGIQHSWALAYLDEERQRDFTAAVEHLAAHRPVEWVYAEQPPEVPGLPTLAPPDLAATALIRVSLRQGRRRVQWLADMHPHGRWLRWHS